MRYYDPDGREITKAEWSVLYHDRRYGALVRSRVAGYDITTSWVGVAADFETRPALYLTWWSWSGKARDDRPSGCRWTRTKEAAIKEHDRRVEVLAEVMAR